MNTTNTFQEDINKRFGKVRPVRRFYGSLILKVAIDNCRTALAYGTLVSCIK